MSFSSYARSHSRFVSPFGFEAFVAVFGLLWLGSCAGEPAASPLHRAPAIPNVVDGVVFESGNWTPDLTPGSKGSSLGNHRAVVEVAGSDTSAEVLTATIPWRRHDPNPAAKAIVVVDGKTNAPIANAMALRVDHADGVVAFQPNAGSTTYYVYYMPWQTTGGPYPTVTYPSSVTTPDPQWKTVAQSRPADSGPHGTTTRIQSVNDFHSFFPMEVIATEQEYAAFTSSAQGGWMIVPEHRDYAVRMRHYIPRHWADRGVSTEFQGTVLKDEYFTFQVAVVSTDRALEDVKVSFEGFPQAWADTLTCFNCGGIDEQGRRFEKTVNVPAGEIQPIWIGVQVPADQRPGMVSGNVVVAAAGVRKTVSVKLDVDNALAVNHGFDEPELMSRLAWLNSTAGTNPDFVIPPFTPVTLPESSSHSLSILGRTIMVSASGLPQQITSHFSPGLTINTSSRESFPILAKPLTLEIHADGAIEQLAARPFEVTQEAKGRVGWSVDNRSDRVSMRVSGALEYDGMLDYRIEVEALQPLSIDDIVMPVVLRPEAAEYMLGLGRMGGKRPDRLDWKWKVENHQEGLWLGGVNRGLQFVLRDDNYVRPLNTNFYQNQPLNLPPSWYNDGRGGIRIATAPDAVTVTNYSGPRQMAAGEKLRFNVRFLITPFKPIDTRTHFNTRFVHKYVPVDEVKAAGGTVVNIHHANDINPYINYPFFNLDQQTAYIEEAHAKGIKVKLYDTIRELTYRAYELFPIRSLGDEIFNDGDGGGHSWLQEHLEDHYHSAWHASATDDAAILDKGTSRWTNYYVEGLAWLAAHQQIDGLYLDDIAFSRETVRRIVSVLYATRPEVVIDLHSANQFNPRDGFINSAMLYMEHFPYMSRLWFGEYFDYSQGPDYWMTEVSGLPFGLMGEMLQDGGHPYRGMLYGMTSRFYGNTDPRPVWAMMNDFGIAESQMRGYWLQDTPVRTGNPRILATAYLKPGGALIALGSWSLRDERISLQLDLSAMGLTGDIYVYAPAVDGLQALAEVDPSSVLVPANQGLFVRVDTRGAQ